MAKNFTPIDELINKHQQEKQAVSLPKESEPLPRPPEASILKETIEYDAGPEVKEYVDIKPETINLPPDLKKLGLEPVTTAKFPSFKNVKLPISDEKVIVGLHAPITSSIRWLATLAVYILKCAHLSLKIFHGRVIRVISR